VLSRLRSDLEKLGSIGKLENGGVFRPSFSDADIEARKYVISLMIDAGMDVMVDTAANIVGIRKGTVESPLVMTGSHIDAGYRWGIFDGPLGVLGAIEAVRMLNEEKVKTKYPVAVVCFSDEEGSYLPLSGSKYFAGLITKEALFETKNKYDGSIFGEVVKKAYQIKGISKVVEKFDFQIKNYVELHIEQGPILESVKKEIGVVNGIVGIRWVYLTFKGQQSHAGTTPMNLRKDATVPAAKSILALRRIVLNYKDMVGTAGVIKVTPNVVNAIPKEVVVNMDIRSLDRNELDQAAIAIVKEAELYAKEEGVELVYSINEAANPVPCSNVVVETIKSAVESLNYSYIVMPSRAGHDAQNVARLTKIGMIFVPSKGGISHSPEEWTDRDYCHKGVEVLKKTIISLAVGG